MSHDHTTLHQVCLVLHAALVCGTIHAEHIPDGMGRAPRTGAELASNDAQRQAAGALSAALMHRM